MFPRALRYIDQSKHLTIMTLILACFSQLDVVKNSSELDHIEDSQERKEAERQLDAFIHHVMHALLPVAATAGVRLIRGLLGVLMTRNDIGAIARTRVSLPSLDSRYHVLTLDLYSLVYSFSPCSLAA